MRCVMDWVGPSLHPGHLHLPASAYAWANASRQSPSDLPGPTDSGRDHLYRFFSNCACLHGHTALLGRPIARLQIRPAARLGWPRSPSTEER